MNANKSNRWISIFTAGFLASLLAGGCGEDGHGEGLEDLEASLMDDESLEDEARDADEDTVERQACDEADDGCALAAEIDNQASCIDTQDIEAGPLWSNLHAQQVCPGICADAGGSFTGQWTTTIPGQMSVCQCTDLCPCEDEYFDVEAGPLWSNLHAQQTCPGVCADAGASFTGQWTTTIPGQMSVCGCVNSCS